MLLLANEEHAYYALKAWRDVLYDIWCESGRKHSVSYGRHTFTLLGSGAARAALYCHTDSLVYKVSIYGPDSDYQTDDEIKSFNLLNQHAPRFTWMPQYAALNVRTSLINTETVVVMPRYDHITYLEYERINHTCETPKWFKSLIGLMNDVSPSNLGRDPESGYIKILDGGCGDAAWIMSRLSEDANEPKHAPRCPYCQSYNCSLT